MMCTAGELNFHLFGFVAVVGSTLLRGIKSIMQGRLLTAPEDRLDAMMLLYHMSRERATQCGPKPPNTKSGHVSMRSTNVSRAGPLSRQGAPK